MGIFDPNYLSAVVTDILSREKCCRCLYTLTPQNPAEPSPAQTEKDSGAASGKSA